MNRRMDGADGRAVRLTPMSPHELRDLDVRRHALLDAAVDYYRAEGLDDAKRFLDALEKRAYAYGRAVAMTEGEP